MFILNVMHNEVEPQSLCKSHQVWVIRPSLLPEFIFVCAGQWAHKDVTEKIDVLLQAQHKSEHTMHKSAYIHLLDVTINPCTVSVWVNIKPVTVSCWQQCSV